MFVYINDLVIFSPSLEQHVKDLKKKKVFEIIKENGLKINFAKCNFFWRKGRAIRTCFVIILFFCYSFKFK